MQKDPETATPGSIISVAIMIIFLLGYFAVSLYWLITNTDNLEKPETIAKFGNWYVGTRYNQNKWTVLYYPFFILRRFLFLFWPVILVGHPAQQLQFLVLFDMAYVIFYVTLRP
jgi:hypothetical protein